MSYLPLTEQEKKYAYGPFATLTFYPVQLKALQAVADSLCELAETDHESNVPRCSLGILGSHLLSLLEQIQHQQGAEKCYLSVT